MEKDVKIIFATGLEIDAKLNATTYIVQEKPDFPDNLAEVRVVCGGEETVYHNTEITEAYSDDGKYRFLISEVSPEILAREKADAQMIYTALITDTLLED